jgi:rod shape-determining protein MreD
MVLARAVVQGLVLLAAALVVVALGARRISPAPDLLLVLVVAWALTRGPVAGAAAGLAAGWLLDLAPPGATIMGLTPLAYAAAGALAGRGRSEGPVTAYRVGLVALMGAVVVQGTVGARAVATNAQVDLLDLGLGGLLTATVAAVVVPLLVPGHRGLVSRRYG